MVETGGTDRIRDVINRLLDRNYEQIVRPVLNAIGSVSTSGVIAQRLRELDDEAARLAAEGKRLTSDNPVLRALLADLNDVLRDNAGRIDSIAGALESAGSEAGGTLTRQLSLPFGDDVLAQLGVAWNRVDPEAVSALVNFVNSAEWADELAQYGARTLDIVRNQAILGMLEGWGPLRVAREIRRMVSTLPASQANNLMRTLFLQSWRRSTAVHTRANARLFTKQIRIATLDSRCCLACIGLHGTEMNIGDVVTDHHQGRCTSINIVRGMEREIPTGQDWFNSLPEAQQLEIAGPGALELLLSGKATLRDFVQPYEDPVFGEMIRQASLKFLGY